ncbi:MAG TPA: hypothetical protein VKT49_01470 [Bryobacteraceae bacterium]|nr:hypothetical protein [Bryobacteraceae bacterium]
MELPRLLLVRQNYPDRKIPDLPSTVARELAASGLAAQLPRGARLAIGVGSRGIRNLDVIAASVVRYWQDQGVQPFLFPAMGSHGGATAAGQADVLAHYGITEAAMGCPIVSQLEVVSLGKTSDGIEAFMDRIAYEADAVLLLNRVKWHTDFSGAIESGLFKMMAIGIGKLAGAQRYHAYGLRLGLEYVIRTVGRLVLRSGKLLGGIAILEDAYHQTAKIDVVPARQMEQREEENLALVKSWMARIPMDLDLLVVDEMGKNISGLGMDTKIINRTHRGEYNLFPDAPRIERIFARDLSDNTYGNALGVGSADVVTDRLVHAINTHATWINALTSVNPSGAHTPIHYPTDRECLEQIMPTTGRLDPQDVRIGWIRNTLELARLGLSENLRDQIALHPLLAIEDTIPMEFDRTGNLLSPFAPVPV